MKKLSWVILPLIIIFAGCGVFDDDDKKVSPAFSGAKYFPLKTGSAWTYRLTETDSLGNQEQVILLNTLLGTTRRNNKTYRIIFDSNELDSLLVRLDNNAIYSLRMVRGDEQDEVKLINFNVAVGKSWVVYTDTYAIQGFVISQNINGDMVGVETIQVPSGTMEDCLRYRITETISVSSNVSTTTTTNQEDLWLAPDIGIVKRMGEYRENNILKRSFVEEVISYSIPQ